MQLFKLYHNEQGINHLTNELKTKSRDLDKLEKEKNETEQKLKSKKQENAKLSREMASVEKKIASKVQYPIIAIPYYGIYLNNLQWKGKPFKIRCKF